VLSGSVVVQARNLLRTGVAVYTTDALGRLLARHLPAVTFADLAVHFECVATSIERAAEHWFADGPLVDAVLASAATPGLFPPVRIGAEHYVDGGVVNSIPVSRAVAHGARCIYVMHVGRVERPLTPPTRPWEVGFVAFELARRHRLAHDLAHLPPGVEVHLLPTGAARATRRSDLRYWDVAGTVQRMRAAYDASSRYLEAAAT
jgi:NTE family protein